MTHEDPYQLLANAIIEKAAEDYVTALNSLKSKKLLDEDFNLTRTVPRSALLAWRDKVQCEVFFRSIYFSNISNLDGRALIYKLREVVD